MKCLFILFSFYGILGFLGCKSSTVPTELMGAYRFSDGRLMSIRKSEGNTLRFRDFESGKTGRLYPKEDLVYISGKDFISQPPMDLTVLFSRDEADESKGLSWQSPEKDPVHAHSINLEKWISFQNEGTSLHGRLNLPDGPGPFPAIVLVHGSGKDAATDYYYNGDFFAAHGIATLTYDKRGTGKSEGQYTFDYNTLASDVIAAVDYLSSLKEVDSEKIGLSGYSQGGWVAPLAASLSDKVSYVLVNYGMIESAVEEARLETRNTLRQKGVKEKHLEEVDELTLAAVKVVASGFKTGWKELKAMSKKYNNAPWRKQLKGTTVHQFLRYPKWLIKMIGPGKAPDELDWYYDSTSLLDSLDIPMVWLLAGSDLSAPNELTIPKLINYRDNGKPFELIVFPDTDHTMLLFEEEDGEKVYTKYSSEYFKAEIESALRLCSFN